MGGMTGKFNLYVKRGGGLDHNYVCKEGGGPRINGQKDNLH